MHIFNPSAFTLAIFSLVLLATGTTHLTWGQEIATTFSLGPRIYMVLFADRPRGHVLLRDHAGDGDGGGDAVCGRARSTPRSTGVPYFVDSDIPSAVFLGLHLLVTDPSTSPRTPLGRAIFGVLYGLGVFGLYALLGALGLPTFYDKLLCVPLLNLAVPCIDRSVRAIGERPMLHALGLDGPLGRANLAHMAVWVAVLRRDDGDRRDRRHAPRRLAAVLGAGLRRETGRRRASGCCGSKRRTAATTPAGRATSLAGTTSRAGWCPPIRIARLPTSRAPARRGSRPGCVNLLDPSTPARANPRALDLRLLVREGGPNLIDMPEPELYARACRHGWSFACDTGVGDRGERDGQLGAVALVRLAARARSAAGARGRAPVAQAATSIRAWSADFVEIPAGPFTMGADPATRSAAFDNERWSPRRGEGTVDLPAFYIARHEVTVGAVRGVRARRDQDRAIRARWPARRLIRSRLFRGPTRSRIAAGSRRR